MTATCPTLAHTLTFDSFGASRGGRALGEPLELRLLPGTILGVVGPNGAGMAEHAQRRFGSRRWADTLR